MTGVDEVNVYTTLCQSSTQIDQEKYTQQKRPKMVDQAKDLSTVESILNFSPLSGVLLIR